jgi:hypothetical protein
MSQTCHQDRPLFDHLVGEREQRRRHLEAKRLGGLEVDDELEFRRLQNGSSLGFSPLRIRAAYAPAWIKASVKLAP